MIWPGVRGFETKFDFPVGRAPGIDLSHPAATNIRMAGVPMLGGVSYIDLRNAGPFTTSGSPANNIIDQTLGPVLTLVAASSQYVQRSGYLTTVDTQATMASFIRPTAVNVLQFTIANGTNSWGMRISATGFLTIVLPAVGTATSTVAIAAGTPYFVAVSINGSVSNFVAVNLKTGAFQFSSSTGLTAAAAPSGIVYVGGEAATNPFGGQIGPTMYAPVFTPMAVLRAWAADPWSFWYPRRSVRDIVTGVIAAGPPRRAPALMIGV